jgi:hypothetical protein
LSSLLRDAVDEADEVMRAMEENNKLGVEDLEQENLEPLALGTAVRWPWVPLQRGVLVGSGACALPSASDSTPAADPGPGRVYQQFWNPHQLRD